MEFDILRVLLVADTHLGFDLPFRPKIKRRRRGHDFFANFEMALLPALKGEVDFVVHGGDLYFRSKIPPALVEMVMAPLIRVADKGVPVFIVPGNHERGRLPLQLWGVHPNIHIFDKPRTFRFQKEDYQIALSGFPFTRKIAGVFSDLVERTRFRAEPANIRFLCLHQTVEGSQVGPSDYTFRYGPDVICGSDIPGDFAAVLCGHIHRAQVLTKDLKQRPIRSPVIYPGSIERTSFAERFEEKSFVLLKFNLAGGNQGLLDEISFIPLPVRPMVKIVVEPKSMVFEELKAYLSKELSELDPNAIVRVQLNDHPSKGLHNIVSAKLLREYAPSTMNISLVPKITRFDNREFPSKNGP